MDHPLALTDLEERHFVDVLFPCAEFGPPLKIHEVRMQIKNYDTGFKHTIFINNIPKSNVL